MVPRRLLVTMAWSSAWRGRGARVMPVLGTSPAGPARGPRPAEYLDDRARGEGHPEGEQETRPGLPSNALPPSRPRKNTEAAQMAPADAVARMKLRRAWAKQHLLPDSPWCGTNVRALCLRRSRSYGAAWTVARASFPFWPGDCDEANPHGHSRNSADPAAGSAVRMREGRRPVRHVPPAHAVHAVHARDGLHCRLAVTHGRRASEYARGGGNGVVLAGVLSMALAQRRQHPGEHTAQLPGAPAAAGDRDRRR